MRTQKNLFALFFVFLLLSCLLVAHADMGPKDQLTVRLVNPPQEPYYLDLLWQPQLQDGQQLYANLSEEERTALDGELLARLATEAPGGLGARVQRRHRHASVGRSRGPGGRGRAGACVRLCGPAAGMPPHAGDRKRQNAGLRAL